MTISNFNTLSKWELNFTFAGFSLLANNLLVKLTSEKTIKAIKDHKYLIFIQTLLKVFLKLFCIAQTAKLLQNNNIISYIISFTNIIKKTNIDLFSIKYKKRTRHILAVKMYAMAYKLDIKK